MDDVSKVAKGNRPMKVVWSAVRPQGKQAQLLMTEDNKILLKVQQGDSRIFFQLDGGEVAMLGLKLIGLVLRGGERNEL